MRAPSSLRTRRRHAWRNGRGGFRVGVFHMDMPPRLTILHRYRGERQGKLRADRWRWSTISPNPAPATAPCIAPGVTSAHTQCSAAHAAQDARGQPDLQRRCFAQRLVRHFRLRCRHVDRHVFDFANGQSCLGKPVTSPHHRHHGQPCPSTTEYCRNRVARQTLQAKLQPDT
jgi:hypothetical protein